MKARAWGVALALVGCAGVSAGSTAESRGVHRRTARWDLAAGPMLGASDMLGPVDAEPTRRAFVGGLVELSRTGGSGWWLSPTFRWGGAWSDFDGPTVPVAGNSKSVEFSVGLASGFTAEVGDRMHLRYGLEVWYGEQRSWLRSRDVAKDGPRAFLTGGAARLRLDHRFVRPLAWFADVRTGAYQAHATDHQLQVEHRWLGQSTSLASGLSWLFAVGRGP